MFGRYVRSLLIIFLLLAVAAAFLLLRIVKDQPLSKDIYLPPDNKPLVDSVLQIVASAENLSPVTVDYPFDGSVFPPEIVAPTFLWHDLETAADLWLIDITFANNPNHIYAITTGKQPERVIDPAAVSSTNEDYKPSDHDLSAKAWTPDAKAWETIKQNCVESFANVTVTGFSNAGKLQLFSKTSLKLMVSKDPVGAPIFYRDVPLMPSENSKGVIKPIAIEALPLITWKLRDISKPSAKVVLEDMPTCVNCHTFSRDGKTLGMDMDGPAGDKGAYAIADVKKNTVISNDDIITWNSYRYSPKGHKNFGLFSQVSPDGKHVVSTLNESTFVVNYTDFKFLQSFYPTRGIFAVYDRDKRTMEPLPGANDTDYVHTNACWSPDGEQIVFSRARAKNKYESKDLPDHANDPRETFIQYDLYTMRFNDGKGSTPIRVRGASENGKSNSFPRYSPDGKWIVYVQANTGQLMRPDSKLHIISAYGGTSREMNCNLPVMNSWHSWSPKGKWLVFSSKGFRPFTQMFLTHIDENGNDSPPILIPNSTADNRAVNIPEFLNNAPDAISAIKTPAQDSYRHLRKAKELLEAEQLAGALVELEISLGINPYYAKAYNDKGFVLVKLGKDDEAVECFKKALELDPELAMAHNSYGFILKSRGQINEAVAYYKRALEIDPLLTNALCNMGNVYLANGEYQLAAEHYSKALEVKPYLAEARSNLGAVFHAQEKYDEAISCFKKALESEADYVPAHYNLGLALQSQKKIDKAIASFKKALSLQDDYVPANYTLGTSLQMKGDVKGAIDQYRKVITLDPNHANAHYSLGVMLAVTGNGTEAIGFFLKSINLDPSNADAHFNLAGLLVPTEQLERAADHYKKVLQLRPDDFKAQASLAETLGKLDRDAEALKYYYEMLKANPDQVAVLNMVAWILATSDDANISDPSQALTFAQKACRLTDNKIPQILDTLAAGYAAAGQFNEAIETAEKAIQLAQQANKPQVAGDISERLELYRQNKPYRQ